MNTEHYDVVVLGGGAVGENVADRVAQGGLSVVIVENELVGGECSYWACLPSKALLRSGVVYRQARTMPGVRDAVTGALDPSAVFARRDVMVHDWDDSAQVSWLDSAGIALRRGYGRISGEKAVTVQSSDGTKTHLIASHAVVVAVGSTAMMPDIPGLADVGAWTSREATSAKTAPQTLAIIGGGVVSVEIATAYASLGTTVTVVSRSALLRGEEPFAGELVTEGLMALGVRVLLGTTPTSVHRAEKNVVISLSDDSRIYAEEVLIATGRVPRTHDIGLDTIGLTPGDWIDTDDTMRVDGFDWLYATGDVTHRALLTHQGKYQARAAGDVIAARASGRTVQDAAWGAHVATADHKAVPRVCFSSPEVASVGLTRAAAEDTGCDIRVVDYDLGWVGGASLHADNYRGQARIVVDEARSVIIGATFVGEDVAELLHAATIAIAGEVPIDRLWHAVPSFPTMSEVWLRLLEGYGRPKHGELGMSRDRDELNRG